MKCCQREDFHLPVRMMPKTLPDCVGLDRWQHLHHFFVSVTRGFSPSNESISDLLDHCLLMRALGHKVRDFVAPASTSGWPVAPRFQSHPFGGRSHAVETFRSSLADRSSLIDGYYHV